MVDAYTIDPLRKINGRTGKVLYEDGVLMAEGVVDYPRDKESPEVKVGNVKISLDSIIEVCTDCPGGFMPLIFTDTKYEVRATE